MGNFRVIIDTVGGHGCDREAKVGEAIVYKADVDHLRSCPDCRMKALVEDLKIGWPATQATLTHWPGEPSQVIDDLAAGKRISGSFK